MTDRELMQLALEALNRSDYLGWQLNIPIIKALREKLAQTEQEPDRVKFERHWRKTRGEKKANRELPRHPLQPQTYIQDSANRHWVTWQAAVKSVSQPASKPLTDVEKAVIDAARAAMDASTEANDGEGSIAISSELAASLSLCLDEYDRAIEAAHGIGEKPDAA